MQARRARSKQSSSRPISCRRPRSPGDSLPRPATRARRRASSRRHGARARIPISPTPTATCGPPTPRASGSIAWPSSTARPRRVALIMAELEEAESGDIGRAREWVARALRAAPDPAWTADGFVSETWMPVSPTGRLDGFEWKVPLAELPSPLIEPQRATEPSAAPAPPESLAPPPAAPAQEVAAEAATETEAAAPVAARPVATVIPIHAPDDPGTEPVPESEPVPAAKRSWGSLVGCAAR